MERSTPEDELGRVSINPTCLVEALEDDPFYVTITRDFSGDNARRRTVLSAYFAYSIEEGERVGCCSVLPDDDRGAAVWTKPRSEELQLRFEKEKHRFLGSILGKDGLADYHRIIGYMSSRSEQVVDDQAWYLSILGVSPRAQGKGLGRRLLEPTLREADRAGVRCFLETFSPRSIPFYERLGFRCIASHIEPVTSSEYWIMVREPAVGPGRLASLNE